MKNVLFKLDNKPAYRAKFKTTGGLEVVFTYDKSEDLDEELYTYVEILGQINNTPLSFVLKSEEQDSGKGRIYFGKYGIKFSNVGDDKKEPTIKPKSNSLFVNNELNKMLSLTEQLFEDVKTITTSEPVETISKLQENTSDKNEEQEKSTTSQIKDLKELQTELLSICSFLEPLKSDELTEEKPFKK